MKKTGFIAGTITFVAGAFILFTFTLMFLWNWLMPEIFNLGVIGFWQAAGLLVLSKILFSGTGHGRSWHSERRKKFWHSRMEEKWKNVPEEKKEMWANKMREKGFHDSENKK